MNRLLLFVILNAAFCAALNSPDHRSCNVSSPEAVVVLQGSAAESFATGDDIYTLTLSCPNCKHLMKADFKKGYGSSTSGTCENCHKRFIIEYSWPRDHDEPTIRKISESR